MTDYVSVIKQEMVDRNLSLNGLALYSGVSRDGLTSWLRGSSPKVSSINKVLNYLGYELKVEKKNGNNE